MVDKINMIITPLTVISGRVCSSSSSIFQSNNMRRGKAVDTRMDEEEKYKRREGEGDGGEGEGGGGRRRRRRRK